MHRISLGWDFIGTADRSMNAIEGAVENFHSMSCKIEAFERVFGHNSSAASSK